MNAPARSPYYGESHAAFRDTRRRFVEREIAPFVDEWDEAEEFPRELYRKAADVGLLGLGFPEEYGGISGEEFFCIITAQGACARQVIRHKLVEMAMLKN